MVVMKDKIICALFNNIKDVDFFTQFGSDNICLKTKKGYIKIVKTQKYIIELAETRKGNFFRKAIYSEKCKYIKEWTYELFFDNYQFNIDSYVYDELVSKRNEYLLKQVNKELDDLCK
jgi:hypothetical protein